MSILLVIGPDIENQLAPFRHYGDTGYKYDRHVVPVDVLPAARDYFFNNIRSHIRSPEGELMSVFEPQFWRDETEQEWLAGKPQSELQNALTGGIVTSVFQKVAPGEKSVQIRRLLELPAGYEASFTPLPEMQSFTEYLHEFYKLEPVNKGEHPDLAGVHKRGWYRIDEAGTVYEARQCTIPNWLWCSWFVGPGDDEEAFKLKPGAAPCLKYPDAMAPGYAHCARKRDIDFAGMRSLIENPARRIWDAEAQGQCYEDIFDEFPPGGGFIDEAKLSLPREQFVQIAADKLLWFEYYIMDGKRYRPPGVTNEERLRNMNAMLEALPADTLLTRIGYRD